MRKLGVVMLVAVGLTAVLTAASLVASFGFSLISVREMEIPVRMPALFLLAGIAAAVLMGVVLIFFRNALARWLFEDGGVDISIGARDVLRMGLVIYGLNLAVTSIAQLGSGFNQAFTEQALNGGDPGVSAGMWLLGRFSTGLVVKFAAGVAVMFASGWLSGLLVREGRAPVAETVVAAVLPTCPECGAPYDPADYRPGAERICSSCHQPLEPASHE